MNPAVHLRSGDKPERCPPNKGPPAGGPLPHFLSKLPFGGLSPLQTAWIQYKQLGDALRERNWATVVWLGEHLTRGVERMADDEQSEQADDPTEKPAVGE